MLVDTNVLVYAYEKDGEKHDRAKEALRELFLAGDAVVSVQNLVEWSRVVTEKIPKPLSYGEAGAILKDLAEAVEVVGYDAQTIAAALALSERTMTPFFDALLAATMKQEGVTTILTENEGDFSRVPGLKVVNPFPRKS